MASWHTQKERELIELFGGEWEQSYGPDGTIGGRPVEVRVAKKDTRFRLRRDVHEELLEEGGSYIFDDVTDGLPPEQVSAEEVDDLLGAGDWSDDRGKYDHKFISVDDIF